MSTIFVKFISILFIWVIKESAEIQNVKLIFPTIVQVGTSATLLCLYDLEGASLYSVQWYRGQFEFFRFVPNENPSTKVFQIPGFYVDTFASNEHQVTLRNIPLQISGEISCEITTEAPRFSTSCISENLTVIDFNLCLNVSKRQYHFRDVIDANCSLTPKLNSIKFIFHWNSKPISNKFVVNQFLSSAQLHLNTSFLDTGKKFPVLVSLRCSAVLNEVYYIKSKSVSFKVIPFTSKSHSVVFTSKNRLSFISISLLSLILIIPILLHKFLV